jgi:hypothetical protein
MGGCDGAARVRGVAELPEGAAVRPLTAEEMLEGVRPRGLVVHGLTRLERGAGADGAWELVAHVELLDAGGHSCKWLGLLVVTLEAPSTVTADEWRAGQGAASPNRTWAVDISTPGQNAEAFDWATRTYRVRLRGLPAWAEAFARGEGRNPYLSVSAELRSWDAAGAEVTLAGRGRIGRRE